ncbi:uncharacterized protein [Miscanthus floridulus]|uniref:uncharacterized protein n=1 Tax=Miscanthus floridulus TaxID=154761 RepID=UPI003459E25B
MTYSAGTTFVFGSWICEAGSDGKLRTCLREEKEFGNKNNLVELELAEKMMKLSTSNPARKGEESGYETDSEKKMEYDSDSDKEMKHNSDLDKKMEHDSNSNKEMEHNPNLDAIFKTKEPHLIGLEDTTTIVKEYNPYDSKKNSIPDIKSSDESEGNISLDEKSDSNENDEQRLARLKKNKLKAGRRNRAKQRKQIWNKYKVELTEYNRKKVEREVAKSTKRERIEELTKELYTLTNNGRTKEDQKKEVGGLEEQLGEEVPQEPQGEQPPKKLNFQRLGQTESANANGRQEHYSKQQERGKPELSQRYQEISRRFDKEDDYRESEFKEDRAQVHDITDKEVIEAFAEGISANWQYKDYFNENPRTNEDFKRVVEELISSEERTRHRFARDNPENRRPNYRQQDKRPRQDNMVATTDNKRRYNDNSNGDNYNDNYNNNNNSNNSGYNNNSNYRSNNYRGRAPENIENMPCHIHPGTRYKLVECSTFQW